MPRMIPVDLYDVFVENEADTEVGISRPCFLNKPISKNTHRSHKLKPYGKKNISNKLSIDKMKNGNNNQL